ncbi:MAG: ABC transporter ATP-binding protein/permease [Treponema sp.]|nr:ABC transporter ATP-binding protein/permease [Treponema sp.]
MLKIFKYLEPKEWLMALVSLGFILAQVWLDLKSPDYMAEITILVQTPGSPLSGIWLAGGKMLLCTLGSLIAAVAVGFLAARIAATFSMQLRSRLFNKVESFSMEEINRFSTDSLITRSTNDITQIQMFVTMGLQLVIKAPITAGWAITKIAGKGYEWTFTTGVAVAIVLVMISFLMIFVMPKFKKLQVIIDNMNRVTRENLTGLRVVRAYNAESYQEEKFEKVNIELTDTHLFISRVLAVMMPVMGSIMSGLSLAIYWIGAYLINAAQVTDRLTIFSNMVVFSSYAVFVIMSFMMLVMIFMILPRASVSAKRINEVLETEPTILDGVKTEGAQDVRGEVVFKNVSFKYPGAADYVLEDVSFTVKQGETIAFIGSTGSGKSTLVNLVPRFFDATKGEILVDGTDIREYTQESLRNKIGYVPQKAVLFRGTVSTNVAFGANGTARENSESVYSQDDVKRAISIAQAAEFTEKMDKGLDSEISQGGTNVSGGQKQRLSIARAVCRKPEIYIFDDSFSALDYKTDRVLRTVLKKETADVTSMIVAQRIGTIMDADQIVVLDEGKIAGKGKHRDLLKTCEVYRQIAMSQLSEEELAGAAS